MHLLSHSFVGQLEDAIETTERIMEKTVTPTVDRIEELIRQVEKRVHHTAKEFRGVDPDDVLQETWIAANENHLEILEMNRPEFWLIRTALNKAREQSRRARRFQTWDKNFDPDSMPAPSERDQEARSCSRVKSVVERVVSKLPGSDRDIVLACLCGNETCSAYSKRMGLKYDTCKSRLLRIKKRLSSDHDLRRVVRCGQQRARVL